MPAVIQRLFFAEGSDFPIVQGAVRVEELFADPERKWEWSAELDRAYVFPSYEAADAEARVMGAGAYPVIRLCDKTPADFGAAQNDQLHSAECKPVSPRSKNGLQRKAANLERNFKALLERMEREHPHERVFAQACARTGERSEE